MTLNGHKQTLNRLIFYPSRKFDCLRLLKVMHVYEQALKQKLNVAKSNVLFSPNTNEDLKEKLVKILEVVVGTHHILLVIQSTRFSNLSLTKLLPKL